MQKTLKFAMSSLTAAAIATPIVAAVSCGGNRNSNSKNEANTAKATRENFFSLGSTSTVSSTSSIDVKGVLRNPKSITADGKFGLVRDQDLSHGEQEPGAKRNRLTTGEPFTTGSNVEMLWNWLPVDQDPTQAADVVSDPKWSERYNYGSGTGSDQQRVIGDADWQFNRATVPLRPRTHGEKLKETQSAFARMSLVRANRINTGIPDGFYSSIKSGKTKDNFNWQYLDNVTEWGANPDHNIKVPTTEAINLAHRNGIPALATELLIDENSKDTQHYAAVEANAGPKGDYPIAKGMVEYALFHGFDGYWFDWEYNTISWDGFLDAYNQYARTGRYVKNGVVISSINDADADIDPQVKEARAKFNYKWQPLMNGNYRSGPMDGGDLSYTYQMHGNDANEILSKVQRARDPFDANSAANGPEDTMAKQYQIWNVEYEASANSNSTGAKYIRKDLFPNATKGENMQSEWFWEYDAPSLNVDNEMWASYAGDPRAIDEAQHWALSNSFQEYTPIVGHNNWATTFDAGMGMNLSLYGSKDIKDNVIGTSKLGWTNYTMQSMLPTYRFIIDTYRRGQTNPYNDYTKLVNGKVQRDINATLNNTGTAWIGGTTLDYSGTLQNVGDSFVNKLYASNVKLEKNDKFTIKIKNKWGSNFENQAIQPELALWLDNRTEAEGNKDFDFDADHYRSDGTESFEWADGTTHSGPLAKAIDNKKLGYNINGNSKFPLFNQLRYEKESSWKDHKRELQSLKPQTIKKVENGSEWLELTYDLSSFAGQRMMDFGIKGVATTPSQDFSQLSLGEMKYVAHNDSIDAKVTKVQTEAVWKEDGKLTQQARITWEDTIPQAYREHIWNYLVFYLNDDGQRQGLAWAGANQAAYLKLMNKANQEQNIEIVAVDDMYNVVEDTTASVKLSI